LCNIPGTVTAIMVEEKPEVDRTSADADVVVKTSDSLKEKDAENPVAHLPRSDEEYNVTLKTWCVVLVRKIQSQESTERLTRFQILSLSYGISFWIVPAVSACQTVTATQLGDPTAAAFYVSLYTVSPPPRYLKKCR
jgi:hypothetical protein